jgi:DNA segregation ATPase FtsK/SpoIIIE-like protein
LPRPARKRPSQPPIGIVGAASAVAKAVRRLVGGKTPGTAKAGSKQTVSRSRPNPLTPFPAREGGTRSNSRAAQAPLPTEEAVRRRRGEDRSGTVTTNALSVPAEHGRKRQTEREGATKANGRAAQAAISSGELVSLRRGQDRTRMGKSPSPTQDTEAPPTQQGTLVEASGADAAVTTPEPSPPFAALEDTTAGLKRKPVRRGPTVTIVLRQVARPRLTVALRQQADLIEQTLAELGVPGHVVAASVGPTVTRLGIAPAIVETRSADGAILRRERVRVARILARSDDLALALGARSIRIEAPVPGEPYMGFEIPNPDRATVPLTALHKHKATREALDRCALPLVLGRNNAGDAVVADLARLPHLLVAGATGAGKSVCVNALLMTLLSRLDPARLRLIVIDPKRVEFVWMEGTAHLLTPVVVDPGEAVSVLGKVETEVTRRYSALESAGVRDLAALNRLGGEQMPHLVVAIDELADLMMVAGDSVERSICRVAQLGRAAGIHLIVATQRPSVDVVTGLIKANLPARLAFAVSSWIDSRTVLDASGAEKLLGRGDFLYLPSDAPKPIRGQGAFATDEEMAKAARKWRRRPNALDPYAEEFANLKTAAERVFEETYQRAVALAGEHDRISVSYIERNLRIGRALAKEVLARLQDQGIIGGDDDDNDGEDEY